MKNFKEMDGNGVWKNKGKIFPKESQEATYYKSRRTQKSIFRHS